MFKATTPSKDVNKFSNSYNLLLRNYSTDNAVYLKNLIIKDDPQLNDPVNQVLIDNINDMLEKIVILKEYRQKKRIK